MNTQNFIFSGQVRIYLQGLNALEADNETTDYQSYFLGSPVTGIKIRDFRCSPHKAAQQALVGIEIYHFAEVFNQPGYAEITSLNGNVEIDIREDDVNEHAPILWMGVVSDGDSLSLAYVDWEVLKPTGDNRTSFAALVRE